MTLQLVKTDYIDTVLTTYWKINQNTSEDPSNNGKWDTNSPNKDYPGGLYGGLTDNIQQSLNFDFAHQTYLPSTVIGDSAIIDNLNGLNSQPNNVVLQYDYATSQTITQTVSESLTIGESLSFSVKESAVVVEATEDVTFNISSTYSFSKETSNSTSQTETFSITDPVSVPSGKIYKVVLTLTEETLNVPFSSQVNITGQSGTWFKGKVNGHYHYQDTIGDIFSNIKYYYILNNGIYAVAPDGSSFENIDTNGWGWDGANASISQSGNWQVVDYGQFQTKVYEVDSSGNIINSTSTTESNTPDIQPSTISGGVPSEVLSGENEGVGKYIEFNDSLAEYTATAYDDLIYGNDQDNTIIVFGGSDIVYGRGGNDYIEAKGLDDSGNTRDNLYGEDGDDTIIVIATSPFNNLDGGIGNDTLEADAPLSILRGGEGNDLYKLAYQNSLGSVIVDNIGSNELILIDENNQTIINTELQFTRYRDDLVIDGDGEIGFNQNTDILWQGFFQGTDNIVNGLEQSAIESLTAESPPDIPINNAQTFPELLFLADGDDESFDPDNLQSVGNTALAYFKESNENNQEGSLLYNPVDETEVSVQENALQETDALFHNLIGLYKVENGNGGILDTLDLNGNGDTTEIINPGDDGYVRTALSNIADNVILQLGANGASDKNTTASQFGDVLIDGDQLYAPFIIANGGNLIANGGSLKDGISAFLNQNPNNEGATAENFLNHIVAYFSFGLANPDGSEHLQYRGNNTFGFEDLPSNVGVSDYDFNDAVFNFTFLT